MPLYKWFSRACTPYNPPSHNSFDTEYILQCMFICGAYVLFKRTFSNVIRKGFRSVFIYFMTSSTRIINYDNEICTGICKNSRIHIFSIFFRSILFPLSYPVNLHVVGFSFLFPPMLYLLYMIALPRLPEIPLHSYQLFYSASSHDHALLCSQFIQIILLFSRS